MIGIFNLFIGWLDYSKWIHKVSFFLLGLSIHGLWCKNSCEILFKPYISIQNLKEHYMSHPRIMPFSNSNSEFRSWWPERLQPCSENPKTGNWEALTGPNRKTWTYKPTNLLLHFKHEIQVIHEGLVPNPPWNCEFIPENGCFKNTILSFSNGLFSGVNLLVVSGRVSIFSKATKKNPQQTPPFHPNLHIHSFFRHGGSTRFNKSLKELGSFGGAMTETTPLKGMTVTGPAGETKKTYTKQLLFDDALLTN